MDCVCPKPAALTALTLDTCPTKFDQIQRVAIQRAGTPFEDGTDIITLASWTTLKAAADSTKIVVTPFIGNFVIPPSEGLFSGGNDNTTLNGIPDYNGEGSVRATFDLKNLSATLAENLRKLSCESLASNGVSVLVAYFINKNGKIIANGLTGFPIYNFRVPSLGSAGLNAPNLYPSSFDLAPGWDSGFVIYDPTSVWNPLTSL